MDRHHHVIKKIGLFTFSLLLCLPAFARKGPPKDRLGWSVGLGTIFVRQVYRDIDDRFLPIPLISYRGPRIRFQGVGATYKIFQWMMLSGRVGVKYNPAGYDPDDSPFLNGMEERKDTLELGGEIGAFLPYGIKSNLKVYLDGFDRHKGETIGFSVSKFFRIKKWLLSPSVGLVYRDNNFTDYYYGVQTMEALSNRPAYTPTSSLSSKIGGMIRYNFNKKWSIMTILNAEFLSSEQKNSPIVDRSQRLFALVGFSYKFPSHHR